MSITIKIPVDINIENILEVDDDGIFYITNYLVDEEEQEIEESENSVEFSTIIEETIDEAQDDFKDNPSQAYRNLYNIAHEFQRYSEKLREVAQKMEESRHIQVTTH